MVCCDGDDCNTWFHGKCLSLTAKKLENVEKWYCPTCAKIERMKKYVDRKHTDLSNSLDKKLCDINNNIEESQRQTAKISKRNNNFVPKQQIEDLSQEKENLLKEVEKLRSNVTELNALLELQKLEHEKAVTDLCQQKKNLIQEVQALGCKVTEIENLMELKRIEHDKAMSEMSQVCAIFCLQS
ncbi:uncharacterized protein LOC113215522 [Frankliniella occidentalis]|uniref:Uncharacterized protein LOC113215522 n=1 Tax=Frankliniella occidentalis TaxID=133901 RepID=A0A6J1TJD3_FRAOC|nr:uncharacterized protein LOC113215522 [Frankliniella occidentalis]